MKYEEMDDAALACACLDGSPGAWRVMVARYQRLVYAIARRTGLDESTAADVFQTVFERLHANLPRLLQPDRLSAWIGTTAKREAIRLRVRGRREVTLDTEGDAALDDALADDPLPERVLDDLRALSRLRRALERLDTRCRELLTAIFLQADGDTSYAEIARRFGLPVGSLGPTRARCLRKLRELMIEP